MFKGRVGKVVGFVILGGQNGHFTGFLPVL